MHTCHCSNNIAIRAHTLGCMWVVWLGMYNRDTYIIITFRLTYRCSQREACLLKGMKLGCLVGRGRSTNLEREKERGLCIVTSCKEQWRQQKYIVAVKPISMLFTSLHCLTIITLCLPICICSPLLRGEARKCREMKIVYWLAMRVLELSREKYLQITSLL